MPNFCRTQAILSKLHQILHFFDQIKPQNSTQEILSPTQFIKQIRPETMPGLPNLDDGDESSNDIPSLEEEKTGVANTAFLTNELTIGGLDLSVSQRKEMRTLNDFPVVVPSSCTKEQLKQILEVCDITLPDITKRSNKQVSKKLSATLKELHPIHDYLEKKSKQQLMQLYTKVYGKELPTYLTWNQNQTKLRKSISHQCFKLYGLCPLLSLHNLTTSTKDDLVIDIFLYSFLINIEKFLFSLILSVQSQLNDELTSPASTTESTLAKNSMMNLALSPIENDLLGMNIKLGGENRYNIHELPNNDGKIFS